MDGTLVDTEPLWLDAERTLLARAGLTMPEGVAERLVGIGLQDAARLFQQLGANMSVSEIIESWEQLVLEGLAKNGPVWLPGAVELLQRLDNCALVTMSTRNIAEAIVAHLPADSFKTLVTGSDGEAEKPRPDCFLRAARELGVKMADCVAFEDSLPGVNAARDAGAVTIGVTNLVDLKGSLAHEVWDSLAGKTPADVAAAYTRVLNGERGGAGDNAVFVLGDRVQLTDAKGKHYNMVLRERDAHSTSTGPVHSRSLLGRSEGTCLRGPRGQDFVAFRPQLREYIMGMPRGATISYPKDIGSILVNADVAPGDTVVEAGVGSGALALYLLRVLGSAGTLHSFEVREDFLEIARANIAAAQHRHGAGSLSARWHTHLGALQALLPERVPLGSADSVLLDMLAPWECVGVAADVLRPGGTFLAYVATVPQLSRTVEQLRECGCFHEPVSSETMLRDWHVDGLAVRPEHRMVGHTGFIVTARRLAAGSVALVRRVRGNKTPASQEDFDEWLPAALGVRVKTAKNARRALRRARADG